MSASARYRPMNVGLQSLPRWSAVLLVLLVVAPCAADRPIHRQRDASALQPGTAKQARKAHDDHVEKATSVIEANEDDAALERAWADEAEEATSVMEANEDDAALERAWADEAEEATSVIEAKEDDDALERAWADEAEEVTNNFVSDGTGGDGEGDKKCCSWTEADDEKSVLSRSGQSVKECLISEKDTCVAHPGAFAVKIGRCANRQTKPCHQLVLPDECWLIKTEQTDGVEYRLGLCCEFSKGTDVYKLMDWPTSNKSKTRPSDEQCEVYSNEICSDEGLDVTVTYEKCGPRVPRGCDYFLHAALGKLERTEAGTNKVYKLRSQPTQPPPNVE